MSVNAYKPHLLVLPEDRADSDIANGFINNIDVLIHAIQVLPYAGGWGKVLASFKGHYLQTMQEFPERRIVLLMDFDKKPEDRLDHIEKEIPEELKKRVFVLGVRSEPEKLRSATNMKYEAIGAKLAEDCAEKKKDFWMHELLRHNEPELNRLFEDVRPFLFH
jgi:hypothetical protein